jgi:hypothetical protein
METLIIAGKEVKIKEYERKINGIMREYWEILHGLATWESDKGIIRKYLKEKDVEIKKINEFIRERRAALTDFYDKKVITEDEYDQKLEDLITTQVDLVGKIKNEIPPQFFFRSTWNLLVKRGVWPFRTPFRSYRHMMKDAERPEMMNAVKFIGEKVLGYKTNIEELPEKKSAN